LDGNFRAKSSQGTVLGRRGEDQLKKGPHPSQSLGSGGAFSANRQKTAYGNTGGTILQISWGRHLSVEGQQPKPNPLAERKRLTFEQAEGVEPLPQQLRLRELSPAFRAAVWNIILRSIDEASRRDSWGGGPYVSRALGIDSSVPAYLQIA
jgi:hypothetical protein